MYTSASLQEIRKHLDTQLPRTVEVRRQEPVIEFGYMTPQMMNKPLRYQMVRSVEERNSKLIGILLCHPSSPLAKAEIVDHLPLFHVISGEAIDFFCAGYGAYWPPNHHVDQTVVTRIKGEDWLFSNEAFSEVVEDLESQSNWKYSGETELLLIPALKIDTNDVVFEFEQSIVCNLEAMAKDDAFTSVRAFFNKIFQFAKKRSLEDSTWELSDELGLEVAGDVLKDLVISLVPLKLQNGYRKASHYAIRSIASDF